MSKTDIITSQNVRIEQTSASVGDRIIARLIDYFVIGCYITGTTMIYLSVSDQNRSLFLETAYIWLTFLPSAFYSFICENLFHGQTLGKHLRHLRVVNVNGSPPTIGALLLRWMCLMLDVWTSCIGVIFIMGTKRGQRLGDLAAGTMVIHLDDYKSWHGSLDNFYYLKADYTPIYPQAVNLSDGQAHLIERTLQASSGYDPMKVDALYTKVTQFLSITPRDNDHAKFLSTILHDYQFYELESI